MDIDTVFNRYDIRGAYPAEIDEAFADRLGRAFGTYAQQHEIGRVVIGRDARDSSAAVYDAFRDGLQATGVTVIDVGVGTTDRVGLASQHYNAYGCMVTASHHAWERTGFKLIYPAGNGFNNDALETVEQLFRAEAFETGDGMILQEQHEFDEMYLDTAKHVFTTYTDTINAKIVVDAVCGTDRIAPRLFEELGATVVMHEWADRPEPEPGETNREAVRATMRDADADLAVGFDPDADRVYLIHPEHGWIDGDRLFYLLADITGADPITASLDTSPLLEETGVEIHYTRVGDVFVSERGQAVDAELLGEPNGHYAVTDFCWYNSGLFAGLLLAAHHDEVEERLQPVARYATERHAEVFDSMAERDDAMRTVYKYVAGDYEVLSTDDGVKFRADDCTVLVRPSGTSPKIRIIVHGTENVEHVAETLRKSLFSTE